MPHHCFSRSSKRKTYHSHPNQNQILRKEKSDNESGNLYLNFAGNCSEALDYYVKHLGAKIIMKTTVPDYCPMRKTTPFWNGEEDSSRAHCTGRHDWHGVQRLGQRRSRWLYRPTATLSVDSNEEAERIYATLTEGGEVFMKEGRHVFRASLWPVPR